MILEKGIFTEVGKEFGAEAYDGWENYKQGDYWHAGENFAGPGEFLLGLLVMPMEKLATRAARRASKLLDFEVDLVLDFKTYDDLGLYGEWVPPKLPRGKMTGHPGVFKVKYKMALDSGHPHRLSAQAELKVAKLLREEGHDIFMIDDGLARGKPRTPGLTNDFTLTKTGQQVDVKRLTSRSAKDLAKGVSQVGEGGMVIVVRGSTKLDGQLVNLTRDELEEFVKNFVPKIDGKEVFVEFRVLDEVELPSLVGLEN